MHLLNWASPTPGASEVGLPHVTRALGFRLRPALKLPEQHFHFSAVVCILIIHLQPASRWSNASAQFICTMQPLRPSKDEAHACRYGVQLHSAALLPERLGQG